MSFIKTPAKGMNDFLPQDMRLREYILNIIKETYTSFGYIQIETPCVEHIENLTNKQGGDNEKLIFKILKRGEKLETSSKDDLIDSGLRYDLTVPLARYYANNIKELTSPFKAFQIGNVWRAERPQKGRFRQFVQCDIDILDEDENIAEIDLITATAKVLSRIGFKKFKIKINDRRILISMALNAGFKEEEIDSVLISLDKVDKIGKEVVKEELLSNNFDKNVVDKYLSLFDKEFKYNEEAISNINQIIDVINSINLSGLELVFDPTLVRGMSYYTGTIFEIEIDGFNGSVGGGGRYDKMIEKFTNLPVSACGFSIGFERIITILKDINYIIPTEKEKTAVIVEKGIDNKKLEEILKEVEQLRNKKEIVLVTYRKKNAKYQKECLEKEGYNNIKEIFVNK